MSTRLRIFCILFSASLIIFCAALLLLSSLLLALGIPLSWLNVPVAAVVTGGLVWWAVGYYFPAERLRMFGLVFGGSALAFIIFVLLNGAIYDVSWDGQTYHAEAIQALINGWNPYRVPSPPNMVFPILLGFFTKGPWISAAALFKLTGNFENGKAFHLTLILASWLMSMAALSTFRGLRRHWIIAVGLLLAFNPVSIYQMYTYYVDGQLSSLLVITVALLILIYRRPDRLLMAVLALVVILTIDVKLSGVIYAGILTGGFFVWYFALKRRMRFELLGWLAAASLIGALFVGYNPFITQFVSKLLATGNPLYPTDWKTLIVIDYNSPPNMITMGRWEKLAVSLFARSEASTIPAQLKLPFTFTPGELLTFVAPDVRVGGFGPLFSGALLLTLVTLVVIVWLYRRRLILLASQFLLLALVLVSALSNSEAWWARYAPQQWLIPVMVVVIGLYLTPRRPLRPLVYVLFAVLCVNNLMILYSYTTISVARSDLAITQLAELQKSPDPVIAQFNYFVGTRYRFERAGIRYQEVDKLPCPPDKWLKMISSETLICTR